MRLINAHKLKIQEFTGDIPPYAILSHRWGLDEEEVAYHEFDIPEAVTRPGYDKVKKCCRQAIADGLHYVWVDTCCIDKRSSAELSEAINSMFNWYRDAVICYAYLEDVHTFEKPKDHGSEFRRSAWFTRGWTLQELLAPSIVVFFTSNWETIGTRNELRSVISTVTNISLEFFEKGDLEKFSVAQKMSWASRRHTKRVEDEAYCLLGVFGVNMPLLYGEGIRAFARLQEEIMKISDDQTLFAWTPARPENILSYDFSYAESSKLDGGLLSPSAAHFAKSGQIIRAEALITTVNTPYSMTNKGLQITMPIVHTSLGLSTRNSVRSVTSQISTLAVDSRLPPSSDSMLSQTASPASALSQNITLDPRIIHTSSADTVPPSPTGPAIKPQRFQAILNCCFENERSSRLAIILESTNPMDTHTSQPTGPFIRANHAQGLISVNIAAMGEYFMSQLLIKPKDDMLTGSRLWSSRRDGRLVLIEPLPAIAAGFELREIIPKIPWKQQADNGGVSLRLRKANFSYGRVALMFGHTSGDFGFLLMIKPINHYDDGEDRYEVLYQPNLNRKQQANWRHRFYDKFILGAGGLYQDGPHGVRIKLKLNIRQAHHALLLKLTDESHGIQSF